MASLNESGTIVDTFPANGDIGVPLLSDITITLSGVNYDQNSLMEGIFVEGPDSNLTIGPGLETIGTSYSVNFLDTPGFQGLVDGTVTVTGISGNTLVTFDPTLPLAASTEYTVNLANVLALDGSIEVSGYISFLFTTGSGSIYAVSSTTSTSNLSTSASEASLVNSGAAALPLTVVKMTPANHSVENDVELSEIVIEFNKALDSTSITADGVFIEALKVTDHPGISITNAGELAKTVEVNGNKLTIKI